jgi:ubiquinone/menaquinone biosynthesis C-methylase UbiE
MDAITDLESDAENWDKGSQQDNARNNFIIPKLAVELNKFKPNTILDIGAATGYVAREVDKKLHSRPIWTLLDPAKNRLSYAEKAKPTNMQANFIVGDLFEFQSSNDHFEAVIMCFTLLELRWTDKLFERLKSICAKNGRLLVVLPDSWCDVLSSGENAQTNAMKFLNEAVNIDKTDKFTRKKYPFIAHRLEVLLVGLTRQGFSLVHFEDSTIEQGKIFMLTFKNG